MLSYPNRNLREAEQQLQIQLDYLLKIRRRLFISFLFPFGRIKRYYSTCSGFCLLLAHTVYKPLEDGTILDRLRAASSINTKYPRTAGILKHYSCYWWKEGLIRPRLSTVKIAILTLKNEIIQLQK